MEASLNVVLSREAAATTSTMYTPLVLLTLADAAGNAHPFRLVNAFH